MAFQMLKMGLDSIVTLFHDVLHDLAFVIRFGLAYLGGNGAFGAVAKAGTQAIAEEIADEPCLTVDHLDGAFRTVWDAEAAASAFVLINRNYASFHGSSLSLLIIYG